jgi:hypothetical protein
MRSMSNLVLAGRTAVAVLSVALGLGAADAVAAPKVQVDPPTIELGTIDEGNSYERFVEVKNVGDGLLVIEEVKSSCGCTAAAVAGMTELKPGQTEKVKVTFNSKGIDGSTTKKVTIVTNDPDAKYTEVTLKATVHMPVKWSARSIGVAAVNPKAGYEKMVSLTVDKKLGLQVKEAKILGGKALDQPTALFDLTQSAPKTMGDTDQIEFTIKLRDGLKPQKISEQLLVVTNLASGHDSLRVPIRGDLVGRLAFNVQFGAIPLADPGVETVRDVELVASEGTFKVVKAEVADSPVKVEIRPDPTGKKTTIRLRYVGETAGTNGVRTLRVETDDPDQPVMEMPVRYQTAAVKSAKAEPKADAAGGKSGPKAKVR